MTTKSKHIKKVKPQVKPAGEQTVQATNDCIPIR